MKRLLLAGVVAGAALAGTAPANASIIFCDGKPVMVQCYWGGGGRWCNVYVATRPATCISTVNVAAPVGA